MFKPDNVDQEAGYNAGLKGLKRLVGAILTDRDPPEHFDWTRRSHWRIGYEAGLRERARRITIAVWGDPTTGETMSKTYRGHADRRAIVNRLAAKGVFGDVMVSYHDGRGMISEHRCGI